MKYFILITYFFTAATQAGFLPNSFRANFEQRIVSTISGQEKISSGSIDYAYPGQIRIEYIIPIKSTFVSNRKKSWYYTPPFDVKEKGDVIIQPSNVLHFTKIFDYLKNGLEKNEVYSVTKEKNEYALIFNSKLKEELSIESLRLEFSDANNKLSDLKHITLVYKDNKKVKLAFSNLLENVKFEKDLFDFKIPENTKVVLSKEKETLPETPKDSGLAYFSDSSFWFDIPSDWQPDHSKGKEIGVPLVLYPKGTTWDSAPSIMYINSASKKDGLTFDQVIASDIKKFHARSSHFSVRSSTPLKTKDGKTAIIKEMATGLKQQPYESIAYIDEKKSVSMMILSSMNEKELERTRSVFKKMVESYSFFTNKVQRPIKDSKK